MEEDNRGQLPENDRQLFEAQVTRLQATISHLEATNALLQAEKEEPVHRLEDLIANQQRQLDEQRREIEQLSSQLRSLELQHKDEGTQEAEQEDEPAASQTKHLVPQSMTFNWRRCKDRPQGMIVYGQPVALKKKLYIRGGSNDNQNVLEYTPDCDQWTELSRTPVRAFTVATLKGQLVVVGGDDKSTNMLSKAILTFDENSQKWVQSYPAMPTGVTTPAVIEYQDHLIVAGGWDAVGIHPPDVHVLATTSNEWKAAQPLPITGYYYSVLAEDTVYLVSQNTLTTLRAHVPTLISGAKSGVWETLPNTPYYWSSPVTVGNVLLTVGGKKLIQIGEETSSIQMYDPTANQWTKVGDLPEPDDPRSIIINSKMFIFRTGSSKLLCVHVSNVTLS